MALQSYLTLKGSKQGQLKGESTKPSRALKWAEIIAFSYGVQVPDSASNGKHAGSRQHQPLQITKENGAASPQILQAYQTSEPLESVILELTEQISLTLDRVVLRVILTGARIVAMTPHLGFITTKPASDIIFDYEAINKEDYGSAGIGFTMSWTATP